MKTKNRLSNRSESNKKTQYQVDEAVCQRFDAKNKM
jgi:hypothetical protein